MLADGTIYHFPTSYSKIGWRDAGFDVIVRKDLCLWKDVHSYETVHGLSGSSFYMYRGKFRRGRLFVANDS